jgi:inorganic pyrophosphatase
VSEETGCIGDNDPIDVIEIGTKQLHTGSITPVKVLGVLALIDDGETDWKVIAINTNDSLSKHLHDIDDVRKQVPGCLKAIREYLRIYKVCTGR